jgi:alkanesulfonate monooxygenase SsuD/methylene tetrahydromethanopterin reductase-like flavin-dependent oxidoreductase (luciferase family)
VGTTTVVEAARRALGPVGVFLPFSRTNAIPADLQRAAVRRLERVGYRATWTNEAVGGKDALVQLAVLLAATERTVFGTGIANIWARQPQTTAREITEVSDRLVDGIVGYGDPAAIAAKVREHVAAGADHVMVMVTGIDFADGVNQLEQLAPALVEFTS